MSIASRWLIALLVALALGSSYLLDGPSETDAAARSASAAADARATARRAAADAKSATRIADAIAGQVPQSPR
ncbi:hypothetical protein [Variovorax boronicumulans]|uniref:hypothetical protein n=1 Tax=Variovorax boronicumulans TaxID=436515 RepID=UPI0012E58C0C|nr:hypothetical protein [Variovorax boronicumulans]GER16724.1 hypothetical protein VCH24_17310 [Variovorax boronicumulans]